MPNLNKSLKTINKIIKKSILEKQLQIFQLEFLKINIYF